MSHIALQRVIVRMLYDGAFRSAVYADATAALSDVSVTEDEAGWLTALDPRAYATDPHVRGRALHGLLSEYSVSGAVAMRAGMDLDAFFSSDVFHQCIQEGHSLAIRFGVWLNERTLSGGDRGGLARIEAGMASLRRGEGSTSTASVTLANHLRVVTVPQGTLNHFQAALVGMQAQNADPATVALDTRFPVPLVQLNANELEICLLESTPTGIGAEVLPEALAELLEQAGRGTTQKALLNTLERHDMDAVEGQEILDGLAQDGLLNRT